MIIKRQVRPLPGTRLARSRNAAHNGWILAATLREEARKWLAERRELGDIQFIETRRFAPEEIAAFPEPNQAAS